MTSDGVTLYPKYCCFCAEERKRNGLPPKIVTLGSIEGSSSICVECARDKYGVIDEYEEEAA